MAKRGDTTVGVTATAPVELMVPGFGRVHGDYNKHVGQPGYEDRVVTCNIKILT